MSMPKRWLLLRGLVREARHWAGFAERLGERLPDGRVVTVDLPGVGTERHRSSPLSIAAIVDDLRARFARDEQPWGLFAASLGGMIALEWGTRYPDDFAHIVVSNTSARDLSSRDQRLTTHAMRSMWDALRTRDRVARERVILGLVSNTEAGRGRAEEFGRLAQAAPIPVSTLARQLFAASRARSPDTLRAPLLVLASEGDRMVSPDCSRVLAKKYGATLHLHPSAGHDLPLDDPDWVIDRLT